jgi:hypothetical protein
MARKRCVICDKVITEQFYVCMDCIQNYDIPYKYRNWPRWLKDLVNIEIKNLAILRVEESHLSFGVPLDNDGESQSKRPIDEGYIKRIF